MREDCLEDLEQAYPQGFLILYLDTERGVRCTGYKLHDHPWLTALYHQAMANAALMGTEMPEEPPDAA